MTTITASAPTPVAGRQAWTVQVEAVLSDDAAAKADDAALENMTELMLRTQGVRSVSLTVRNEHPAVLAVRVRLAAPDWNEALGRATALVHWCARYAGISGLSLLAV